METRKIGNYEIGEKEFQQFLTRLPKEQQTYAMQNEEYRKQVEERLEEFVLFAALGDELKLEETAEFKETLAMARRDILSQMAMAATVNEAAVDDDEVAAYYEEHKNEFESPEMASAKHILVDSEEKAADIKAKIESEEISFEEAAKEHSSCPSSAKGGDLGQFGRGQMVPEFEQAVFGAEPGDLVGPVKTQFGYHVIEVGGYEPASQMSLDEVKTEISQHLLYQKQNEAYEAKLAELKEKFL